MQSRDPNRTSATRSGHGAVGALLGMLIFALVPLAVGLGLLAMRQHSSATRAAASTWRETPCVIEVCEFRSTDDGRMLDLVFRYTVDGQAYRGDQLDTIVGRFGDDDVFEESIHASFPPGAEAVCFVNPDDPGQAVFRRDRGADAPRRMFLLAFPFLTVGLVFSGLLLAALVMPNTPDDDDEAQPGPAAELIARPPPRAVPFAARLAVMAGPLGSQIAWFFLVGFVFIFVIMDGPASWARLFRSQDDEQTVTGRVTDVRKLDSRELSVPVYQYLIDYEFAGRSYQSGSFTRGRKYSEGEEVPIVVSADRPDRGAIVGARPSELTWWHSAIPLGVVLLLVLGLLGMYRHGVHVAWLLRHGVAATARRGEAAHQTRHEDEQVPSMTTRHQFSVQGASYRARRYSPGQRSRGPDEVTVLYDPRRPKRNVLLSSQLEGTIATSRSAAGLLVHCVIAPLALLGMYVLLRGAELL